MKKHKKQHPFITWLILLPERIKEYIQFFENNNNRELLRLFGGLFTIYLGFWYGVTSLRLLDIKGVIMAILFVFSGWYLSDTSNIERKQ